MLCFLRMGAWIAKIDEQCRLTPDDFLTNVLIPKCEPRGGWAQGWNDCLDTVSIGKNERPNFRLRRIRLQESE